MTVGGAFEVDPQALLGVSSTAHEQAEQVRGYVKSMRMLTCPSPDVLGEYGGVDTAYGSFLNAWCEEFELTAAALDESSVKLKESAQAYARTDKVHADGMAPR
jgi:hypothetical protein